MPTTQVVPAGTSSIALGFPVLQAGHLKAVINGTVTAYTAFTTSVNSTTGVPTVTMSVPPTNNIKFYRETPRAPLVDFQPGQLTSSDLDLQVKQQSYIAEEIETSLAELQDEVNSSGVTPSTPSPTGANQLLLSTGPGNSAWTAIDTVLAGANRPAVPPAADATPFILSSGNAYTVANAATMRGALGLGSLAQSNVVINTGLNSALGLGPNAAGGLARVDSGTGLLPSSILPVSAVSTPIARRPVIFGLTTRRRNDVAVAATENNIQASRPLVGQGDSDTLGATVGLVRGSTNFTIGPSNVNPFTLVGGHGMADSANPFVVFSPGEPSAGVSIGATSFTLPAGKWTIRGRIKVYNPSENGGGTTADFASGLMTKVFIAPTSSISTEFGTHIFETGPDQLSSEEFTCSFESATSLAYNVYTRSVISCGRVTNAFSDLSRTSGTCRYANPRVYPQSSLSATSAWVAAENDATIDTTWSNRLFTLGFPNLQTTATNLPFYGVPYLILEVYQNA